MCLKKYYRTYLFFRQHQCFLVLQSFQNNKHGMIMLSIYTVPLLKKLILQQQNAALFPPKNAALFPHRLCMANLGRKNNIIVVAIHVFCPCHRTASNAYYYDPHTFHCDNCFVVGGICTIVGWEFQFWW